MHLSKRPDPADQALFVEFHDEAKFDPEATKLVGMDQFKDVLYCKVVVDPFTVNDCPARDDEEYSDIKRFPDAYEIYKSKKTGERVGTPLKFMTSMTPAKIRNYENADIYSIEQLAHQPDQTISKHMGGLADRKAALLYIDQAKDDYKNSVMEKKFEAIQAQLDTQKDELEEKNKIIADLMKAKEKPSKGKEQDA